MGVRLWVVCLRPELETGNADALRVLVVDDSRLQRRLLSASLTRWGYDVVEAGTGGEALEICAENPPALILSDWMMPGMDGLELCQAFRRLPHSDYSYFILLTSKNEKEAVAQGLGCGADDFLTKPVDPAELRARINAGERLMQMQRELSEKNRLISATLDELQLVHDAIEGDLIEARKLQQSLLRERFRDFGPGQVSLILRSCGHVGGDLVGFYPIAENRVGLYAIDVSGHGISSALMTARLAGYLSPTAADQNIALEQDANGDTYALPPAQVLERLNRLVLGEMDTEHYFTMVLADADLRTGRVRLAQAGHPHPLVLERGGGIREVGDGGLPVGLIDGAEFEQVELTLAPGDRLLLRSDGLADCTDSNGALLDEEGLLPILDGLRDLPGPALLETLIWRLHDYCDGGDFPDDISALLLDLGALPSE